MKRLLLDCDGVIADCSTPVHRFAQDLLKRELPHPETWTSWDHAEAMGLAFHEARKFHEHILTSDVCWDIALFPGADETIYKLMENFELVFVTSHWRRYPDWVPARERLLSDFNCPIVFTHDKHLVHGDLLVDDHPKNLLRTLAKPILFDATHNRGSEIYRIYSLEELLEHA